MRFTNGSYTRWNWMQSADMFSGNKWNTAAVAPERPCVPRSPLRQQLTRPNSANRRATAERRKARDGGEQDKSVASYAAPLVTSARSAGSLRETGVGSKAEGKPQIEVAQRRDPPVARHSDDVFGRERRHFDG